MLIQKPVVPCSICGVVMVELGPMGDTGTKKCNHCKNQMRYQKRDRKYYKHRTATCRRCGKTYSDSQKKICSLCAMIVIDLYKASQNRNCIYCDKYCGAKDFCSRVCASNTANMARSRDIEMDMVIKD